MTGVEFFQSFMKAPIKQPIKQKAWWLDHEQASSALPEQWVMEDPYRGKLRLCCKVTRAKRYNARYCAVCGNTMSGRKR